MPGLSNDRSFPEPHSPNANARLEAFRKDLLSGEEFQKALAHPHAIDFLCHLDLRDSSCRDLVQKTLCVEGAIGTLVHGAADNPYQQEKLAFLIENRLPKQRVQIFWQPWAFHDMLIFGLTDRYLRMFQDMRDPDDANVLCTDGALQGLVASKNIATAIKTLDCLRPGEGAQCLQRTILTRPYAGAMLASNGAAEWVADCLKSQASFDLFEMLAAPQMLASLERVLEPPTLQVVTGKLSSRQLLALSDMQNFDNMPISSQRAERWSTGRNAMISELGKGKQQPLPSMVYRS